VNTPGPLTRQLSQTYPGTTHHITCCRGKPGGFEIHHRRIRRHLRKREKGKKEKEKKDPTT
jgi:hypothetical protein